MNQYAVHPGHAASFKSHLGIKPVFSIFDRGNACHNARHMNSIKTWPEAERPRERLLKKGPDVLSNTELLAVLLGNGVRGKDAIQLAREMISVFGGWRGLFAAGPAELERMKGLGAAKIAMLLASAEIARRHLREGFIGKDYMRDPQAVVDYLYGSLRDRKTEVFKVLFLNKANRVTDEVDLFHGTVDETAIHCREVVKAALERHATAIILVHNHPSGRIEPSAEDREITVKLKMACGAVSVKILDHLIIGDNQYFSFSERGLLAD